MAFLTIRLKNLCNKIGKTRQTVLRLKLFTESIGNYNNKISISKPESLNADGPTCVPVVPDVSLGVRVKI